MNRNRLIIWCVCILLLWWVQSNPCAICLAGMGAGGGQAIFTAECSHTFHFHCISESVAPGNLVCPLCNARWRELPSVVQPQPAPVPRTLPGPCRQIYRPGSKL